MCFIPPRPYLRFVAGILATTFITLVLGATPAPNQTTQQTSAAWTKSVETFASGAAAGDANALAKLVTDDVEIESLDSRGGDALQLLARAKGGTVTFAGGYEHPPKTLASDLAASLKNAPLPEEMKKRMAVRDEDHARRANIVAAEWLRQMLGAKEGDWVGVAALWCDSQSVETSTSELIFVLMKAQTTPAGLKVKRIVFGNP